MIISGAVRHTTYERLLKKDVNVINLEPYCFQFQIFSTLAILIVVIFIPNLIRRSRKRTFLLVFDSFGSERITAVFHGIVNERKRSDNPFFRPFTTVTNRI
jgi:hypothetical protein